MSSSYFTPNQADLVSSAPAFYSQEVSTEYHVQSYDMSLSINNETSCYRISMPVEDGEGHRAQVTSDIDQYAIAHVAFDFENSFELIALSTPPNRGNTRLDPDHKNHADSTKHKSDLLKICSSLNELHCTKGLSS